MNVLLLRQEPAFQAQLAVREAAFPNKPARTSEEPASRAPVQATLPPKVSAFLFLPENAFPEPAVSEDVLAAEAVEEAAVPEMEPWRIRISSIKQPLRAGTL